MKNLLHYLIAMSVMVSIFSCSKDNELIPTPKEQGIMLDGEILRFETTEKFYETLTFLQKKKTAELAAWEAQFPSFESYRAVFEQANEELELIDIDNETARDAKVAAYADILLIGNDNEFTTPSQSYHLSTMLTTDGLVYIEGVLHRFTADQQIMSVNENLAEVLRSTTTDEAKGLYVSQTMTPYSNNRTSCSNTATSDVGYSTDSNKKYKIIGEANLHTFKSPVRNSSSQIISWNVFYHIALYHKTYKKNVFGNYKGNKHCSSGSIANTFESGWRVPHSILGTLHGGYGWGYPECRNTHSTYVHNPNGSVSISPSQINQVPPARFDYVAFRVHTDKVPPIANNPDPMDIWCAF